MKSLAELNALRDKEHAKLGVRSGAQLESKVRIVVSMGTCGIAAGARAVLSTFVELVAQKGIYNDVVVGQTSCVGSYGFEPMVTVFAIDGSETIYIEVTPDKATEIVDSHIVGGTVVTDYLKP